MLVKEFKEKYKDYYAYQSWVSVHNAKELGLIPEKYWEFFDDFCECGSENMINSNLRQEMCCDPGCTVKQGYQLAEMFASFGIKGIAEATCSKIYHALRQEDARRKKDGKEGLFVYNTIVEVLRVQWKDYPYTVQCTSKGADFFSACVSIQQKPITFPKLIASLGLHSLGSNASNIFDGINSFAQLKQMIEKAGGVPNFCISRGIASREKMLSIKLAMESIAVADFIFQDSIRQQGLRRIDVCITGAITLHGTPMRNKSTFIEECNKLCKDANGVQLYEFSQSSAVKSAPFIVYSVRSNSSKFVTGSARGEITDDFGTHAVLITADEFYNLLERKMDEWNQNLKDLKQPQEPLTEQTTLLTTSEESLLKSPSQPQRDLASQSQLQDSASHQSPQDLASQPQDLASPQPSKSQPQDSSAVPSLQQMEMHQFQ